MRHSAHVWLTSKASKVTKLATEKPSMMSSSAEEDSFLFLLGGLGRAGGSPLSSLSDPEDDKERPSRPPPLPPREDPPLSQSLSLWDRDLRFLASRWWRW
ncbi:hypothetical protein NDU88_001546 [Pleurodeles waltl]|uniref:Uncharacterized protein n=1 Tax=Pleurodeles waltl TaxID=8319 RepID=A0AAV7U751_PLEWA|nr:hypothetical protein NDU88_001546 [Pleurodeles waltl]